MRKIRGVVLVGGLVIFAGCGESGSSFLEALLGTDASTGEYIADGLSEYEGQEGGGADASLSVDSETGEGDLDGDSSSESGDCSEVYEITSSDLTGDVNWSCGTYRIAKDLRITDGTLTVAPCTTIEMSEGSDIKSSNGGRFVFEGAEECPIVLTSQLDNPYPGAWEFVSVGESSQNPSIFRYVHILYAGEKDPALTVSSGTKVILTNSRIEYSGTHGLSLKNSAELVECKDNVFANNEGAPVEAHVNSAGQLGEGVYEPNGTNKILLKGGAMERSATWINNGIPYVVDADFDVKGEGEGVILTLDAGVEIQFEEGSELDVQQGGTIIAEGTADAPVVLRSFMGADSSPGDWDGVVLSDGVNRLDHVRIEFADDSGVYIKSDAKLAMNHTTVQYSSGVGVRALGELLEFSDNTLVDNGSVGLSVVPPGMGNIGKGTYSPNGKSGILVESNVLEPTKIYKDMVIQDQGVPYVMLRGLDISGEGETVTVTLEEGVTLRMGSNQSIEGTGGGNLRIKGTLENPVTITSTLDSPTPGDWNHMYFKDAGETVFEHVDVVSVGLDL